MNAPYDGDRGQGAGSSGYPEDYPDRDAGRPGHPEGTPETAQMPQGSPADMYLQDAYDQDPYRAQDLSAQDPVSEALYDRAAHPPPAPGTYAPQQPLYAQPPASQYAPDPRLWAQTPPPEPSGPTRHLPYGDDARTTQYVGVDDLVTQAGEEQHEPDAFLISSVTSSRAASARATPPPPRSRHRPPSRLRPLSRPRPLRRSPAAAPPAC